MQCHYRGYGLQSLDLWSAPGIARDLYRAATAVTRNLCICSLIWKIISNLVANTVQAQARSTEDLFKPPKNLTYLYETLTFDWIFFVIKVYLGYNWLGLFCLFIWLLHFSRHVSRFVSWNNPFSLNTVNLLCISHYSYILFKSKVISTTLVFIITNSFTTLI